jgi:hypothetical protein
MSLSETDTMSRRTAKLIFYRDLSKVFIATQKIIIIYDFDLAGVTGAKQT